MSKMIGDVLARTVSCTTGILSRHLCRLEARGTSPISGRVALVCLALLAAGAVAEAQSTRVASSPPAAKGMMFLHYADARFIEGLRRHGLLDNYGFRLLNTGYDPRPFGERWAGSKVLADAGASGRCHYFDRITGGMPFQSLEGMTDIARRFKDDPRFLGFQVHEWGNSPFADYGRIQKLILDKGRPFDQKSFAEFERRTQYPYFSGGDFRMYHDLYRPLKTQRDVEAFLEAYFRRLIELTAGQVMSVNGYVQMNHTALRLGAKNIMPEIGNQVPLSALQIACARGAARQYDKPFGVYYEPWGGTPFGCCCALGFSPWFPAEKRLKEKTDVYQITPKLGSSRSLQRRLLYFSWLAGAAYVAEEWGTENYFSDWETYPLTAYGRVVKEFLEITTRWSLPQPVVPAAVVAPPGTFGIDVGFVSGRRDRLYGVAAPDAFHTRLRRFAKDVFATQSAKKGGDAHNLTPSPWIGCFDVLSAEATPGLLAKYAVWVYFDAAQAEKAPDGGGSLKVVYTADPKDSDRVIEAVGKHLRYQVQGQVGCAHARVDGRYLLGVFNNLGITKTPDGDQANPEATQTVTVIGPVDGVACVVGKDYLENKDKDRLTIRLPAGQVAILSFPDPAASR
ncbi:MAG: hypothetical protein JXQ73_20510 [Phycisphaerae bacterium]|nr:hypothetical protein [Phycisphaerae bacterium]